MGIVSDEVASCAFRTPGKKDTAGAQRTDRKRHTANVRTWHIPTLTIEIDALLHRKSSASTLTKIISGLRIEAARRRRTQKDQISVAV